LVADGRPVELPIAFKVRCGGEYTGTKGGEVKPTERGGTGMLHYEDKTFTVAATQDQFVATPVTYSIREDSSANTFHVKETDTALCVTSIRPSPMAQHAQNFIVQPQQLLYENHPNDSRVTGPHDVAPTIAARFGTGGGNVPFVQNVSAVAFQPGNLARRAGSDPSTEVFPTLSKDSGDQNPHVAVPMAVRRLTPEECEALQGFPRNHTRISWRGKSPEDCPDGPRYKAIGNSMATNCMHWIGRRIQLVDDLVTELNQKQG
jgi:site-specific DNA-cytosine methylase